MRRQHEEMIPSERMFRREKMFRLRRECADPHDPFLPIAEAGFVAALIAATSLAVIGAQIQ